ncbi:Replicative DNA helicase [Xanthomonas hortorum pv. vitians]|uniref:Replicative DNA helicase n=2 Tax=Xanthomonas hortorum TaxID=56454 RepID=A0A6V7EQ14_9XANT|nr:replicative DNA helicase [Xanthomonas hortorum]APP85437.1 replicative DNA helicase [Xanthomonas hortorum pv. gardneri]MCE4302934.1 replicative DNA helicase [Xanthomonas hortorum pv. vitians]MCE4311056.1 replicative DNA helicase [Xanthomonas hortorum pv. vitians]MDT7825257.1 replicative DNA helicase [Xanthomonas hortorum pv. vitians]NMI31623.1 replicative DNA helicase [Xanthomonas hortorum pv. vitians]
MRAERDDDVDRLAGLYGDQQALRVPPHSIDAEQSVLGGVMLLNRAAQEVTDLLSEQSFYRRDHQLIWRAICELAQKGQPIDVVTLGEWFESQGKLELVGDGAYLIELSSTVPSAANIRAYAEIVAEKAMLRDLIQASQELMEDAYSPAGRTALDLVGHAQSRIGGLLDNEPCDLEAVGPVMARVFDQLSHASTRDAGITGLSTGMRELDALLDGLQGGRLYVLAARPKMGKTTLAQNIAEQVALRARRSVAFFSFEMKPEELGKRMLCNLAGVSGNRMRSGELDEIDWRNVTEWTRRIGDASLRISRPRVAKVQHVCAQVRRMKAQDPNLSLVVIDYLQLMHVSGDNRASGIGDITRALKLMASEIDVAVVLLSQLNRDVEKRNGDKRPIVADLRDSGSIEQDADAVVFIYRDEIYHKDSAYEGTAELIAAIQRDGAPGTARVAYAPGYFRFSDLPEFWQPRQTSASAPIAGSAPAPRRRGLAAALPRGGEA